MYKDLEEMSKEDADFLADWFDRGISRIGLAEVYDATIEEVAHRYGRLLDEYGAAQIRQIKKHRGGVDRLRRRRVSRAFTDALMDYCDDRSVVVEDIKAVVYSVLDAHRIG